MYSFDTHRQDAGCPTSRRRTRWGPESQATQLNGLKTAITTAMTPEQLDAYALRFRIEEIGQELRSGNQAQHTNSKRSPSPPPEYDSSGRRINTRQYRYRQRLEEERRALVGVALNTIPRYQAPRDFGGFRRPLITDKVYVPVKDFPEVNFIGQILGPRGRSLTDMNNESGAKIALRGKGSVKEGRAGHLPGQRNANATPGTTDDQHEPLHCLIRADTQEKVDYAKKLINEVIEAAASAPEGQNQRKRDQLRQLAMMNGTFRDDEHQACDNCGQSGHRHYFCTMPKRFTAGVTCYSCKNAGHVARDCPAKTKEPAKLPPWRADRLARRQETTGHDVEFEQLMLELGK